MTRSDIIELANSLTERKGEKVLPMMLLFATVCQDICQRGRHWWRKWDVTFNLTQNVKTYDLTNAGNFTPALTDIAVEEIVAINLIMQASPLQVVALTPIFDPMGIIAMKQNVTLAQPSRYMIDPNTWSSLRIDPPDQTYLAEMTFWAMPNLAKESSSDAVPVIPPIYHNIITSGLEAVINKRVYGPNDARYRDSKETYEQKIVQMMMRPQFTSNYNRQWTDSASSHSGGSGAVQSTSPNSP